MTAVLLAGGKGTRLRPHTDARPKPLMPLGELTVVEVLLHQLANAGIREVLLCVGHLAPLIEEAIGDGERYGVRAAYRREDSPRGTIGPVRACASALPERFLVINGDILCDLDFAAFYRAGQSSPPPLTMAVCERAARSEFGVVDMDPEGRVRSFREKPVLPLWVNMGVYTMSREVLEFIPDDRPFGIDDQVQAMLAAGASIATFPFRGRWFDIGRGEDLDVARSEFERHRERFLPRVAG